MARLLRNHRIVPALIVLGLAAVSSAQISNVNATNGYNNEETASDNNTNNQFGFNQQFFFPADPPATVESSSADFVYNNLNTGGSGEVWASSSSTAILSTSSTVVQLLGTGYAESHVVTTDATSTYWSAASGGFDMDLHLDSAALVTFSVGPNFTATGYAGCQFGYDNFTFVKDYLTSGAHTTSTVMGAGDHNVFMFYYSQSAYQPGPLDSFARAGGDYSILVDTKAVPEPASLTAMAVGAIGLLKRRRKAA